MKAGKDRGWPYAQDSWPIPSASVTMDPERYKAGSVGSIRNPLPPAQVTEPVSSTLGASEGLP